MGWLTVYEGMISIFGICVFILFIRAFINRKKETQKAFKEINHNFRSSVFIYTDDLSEQFERGCRFLLWRRKLKSDSY